MYFILIDMIAFAWFYISTTWWYFIVRGGVEDARLEAKAKAKDSLSEDRHSRGQGQECSRPKPRTKDTSVSCSIKKKKGLHKNFSGDLKKKRS